MAIGRMLWYGRLYGFGSWLSEECYDMEDCTVVAHGCRKTKRANIRHRREKCCSLWPPTFPARLSISFVYMIAPTNCSTYTIYVSIKLRGLLVFSLRHVTNFNWSNWKNLDRLDFLIFFIKCIWYKELSGWLSMIMQIYEWNPTCLYCLAAFSRFHLLQQTLNCTNLQRSA